MTDVINIEFTWNSTEAITANSSHRLHTFRKPFRIAANVIAALAMFAGIYRVVVFGWAFFPIIIFAGGFYWIFIRNYDIAWSVRRRFRRRPDKDKMVIWNITDTSLHSSVEGMGEATIQWESLYKVVQAPKGFLFYPNNQMYNWLPYSGFLNHYDIERLKELVRTKIKNYIKMV